MALIIKGNMPSCCAVCWECNCANDGNFCNRTGNRLGNDWQLFRPLNCPIIGEIPDEHGDLIDIQAVEERAKAIQYEKGIPYNEALLVAFDTASVVVEASK